MRGNVRALVTAGLLALLTSAPAAAASPDRRGGRRAASGEPWSSTSEFLGDLPLRPVEGDPDRLVYARSEGVLRGRRHFVVEPVLVYLDPDSPGRGAEPGRLAKLAGLLETELADQLRKGGFEVADDAAPGAVRLRCAITDLNLSVSGANAAVKGVGAAAGVGLLVPSVDVGGASVEALFVDGDSGEVLAAVAESRTGRRWFNMRSMTRAGDAKQAFRKWAKQLRKHLQRVNSGDDDG